MNCLPLRHGSAGAVSVASSVGMYGSIFPLMLLLEMRKSVGNCWLLKGLYLIGCSSENSSGALLSSLADECTVLRIVALVSILLRDVEMLRALFLLFTYRL